MKKLLLPLLLASMLLLSACGGSTAGGDLGALVQGVVDTVNENGELRDSVENALSSVAAEFAPTFGRCGQDITWRYADGVLTLEGTGPMENYDSYGDDPAPWQVFDQEITQVYLSEGITTVGSDAFTELSCLRDVSLPSTLTEIYYGAFSWCEQLEEITIPNGVTEIGGEVFSRCSSLQEITIPYGVTKIGFNAFSYCYNLEEVTLPDSLTEIGDGVFSECFLLKELTIPASVTRIGSLAFAGDYLVFLGDAPTLIENSSYDHLISTNYLLAGGEVTVVYYGEGFGPYISAYMYLPGTLWVEG